MAALRRLLDERDPAGGTAKAAVMLCHPGPSLLVTAVAVAAGGLLTASPPGWPATIRLALIVLPAQLATGAANDLADVADDRRSKPHKPLVRGAVPAGAARAIAVIGTAVALVAALTAGPAALAFAAAGAGAGLAYDLGLKRSPLAVLAWWAGFTALPFGVAAVTSSLRPGLAWALPLTALLAVLLHVANALPDLAGDRAAGVRSLPVLLGRRRARQLGAAAGVAVALLVAGLAGPLGQNAVAVDLAATGVGVGSVALMAGDGSAERAFAPLALLSAVLAACWLGALPR